MQRFAQKEMHSMSISVKVITPMDIDINTLIQGVQLAYSDHIKRPSRCVGQITFGDVCDEERKEIAKFFSIKDWKDVDLKSLSFKRYYIYGLTPDGLYYYLPAFFLSCLTYLDSEVTESLVFLLVDNAGRPEVRALVQRLKESGKLTVIKQALGAISEYYYSYCDDELRNARERIELNWKED